MSESDKSGKQELSDEDRIIAALGRKQFDLLQEREKLKSEINRMYVLAETRQLGIDTVTKRWELCLDELKAAQARIAELEAISKALIKTLQVSLPIVSAPLRETFEIAIAKAKDKLLKP